MAELCGLAAAASLRGDAEEPKQVTAGAWFGAGAGWGELRHGAV